MLVGLLVSTLAMAGYGDAQQGRPTHDDRAVHLWTNAVRIDPTAFQAAYLDADTGQDCWPKFSRDERQGKLPLSHNAGLNEVATIHSVDMRDTGVLSHDSSDGTDTFTRIQSYYRGQAIGENVAVGYTSPYQVVLNGWMCSDTGHRASIMSADFEELGVGRAGRFWTQNFGSRGRGVQTMNMGVHLPAEPKASVQLWVDVVGDAAEVSAILDGVAVTMAPEVTGPAATMYRADVDDLADGCHTYFFEATVDGEAARFPEEGAYGWGDCDFDDAAAGWLAVDPVTGPAGEPVSGSQGCGCSGAGLPAVGWPFLVLLAVRRRR